MATDNFLEEVATRRNRGLETGMYIMANVLMAVCAVAAFMLLMVLQGVLTSGDSFSAILITYILPLAAFCGMAVLLFFRRDRIRTEFEYTFTNGQMDFAQVFNNKKRKNLGTMNIKNVEALGLVNSGSFRRYLNMQGVKVSNWFVNRDAQLFYFYFSKEGVKRLIVIEVSEEMLGLLKKYAAPGTFQVN
ncbi:MAG: hypothetical protein IJS53_03765 [Clostridia bacterium]|nr:hypothetical protein [Clostridia bacterium]